MPAGKKIGVILFLVGLCLPTASLPFITEFKPMPELCLTSNFFQNMGNMVVAFNSIDSDISKHSPAMTIPYRYLFSIGVILVCVGLGTFVLSPESRLQKK